MLEMKRDVILKLKNFRVNRKQKIRTIIGLCDETYDWKNHYLFEESKKDNYSFRIILSNGQMACGKYDADISKVCFTNLGNKVELYENIKDYRTIEVKQKEITNFEFVMYSSKNIDDNFLYGCESLTVAPVLPESVECIGTYFLSDCWSLGAPPVIPESVRNIGDFFLCGCPFKIPPVIPKFVTKIGDMFLYSCGSLVTPPVIPESSGSISDGFLSCCSSLTTPPIIPESVTSIGDGFLSYCSSLTTPPIIPESVRSIGRNFLYRCSSLRTPLIIPESVTSIGNN